MRVCVCGGGEGGAWVRARASGYFFPLAHPSSVYIPSCNTHALTLNTIYIPCMTVYLVISLLKLPHIHLNSYMILSKPAKNTVYTS